LSNEADIVIPVVASYIEDTETISPITYSRWHRPDGGPDQEMLKQLGEEFAIYMFSKTSAIFVDAFFNKYNKIRGS
jgi:hypothetical protein